MRSLLSFRRAEARRIQRLAGQMPERQPIVSHAEVANLTADTDLARYEEEIDECDIQTANGGWRFQLDNSVLDGGDTLS